MNLNRFRSLLSIVATAAAIWTIPASAATPTTTAIEGALTASGGAPAADGYYNVTFAVFKDATGGNPLWIEGPVSVAVKGGTFQYQLGSKTPLQASVFSGLPTAYISMKIESDPELPRQPMTSVVYALRAAVAEGIECSGCVGASAIDPQVLAAYVKASDLGAYAKTSSLAKVATTGAFSDLTGGPDLSGYAKTTDLSAYAKSAGLAKVATTGAFSDLTGGPDLSGYAKTTDLAAYVKAASLAKVAGSGAYADLSGAPTPVTMGKTCGTGLVMNGIKADGSYSCIASAIAADMIDEISNGLIFNQFVDSTPGTGTIKIPDGLGAGVTDTLTFPDIGQAQQIWVNMTINNSDMSGVKVELYGPGILNPYVLYAGGKTGTTLTTNFNTDTPIVSGDMTGDWANKNIKGAWSITVKDTKAGGGSGGFDGDFKWSMNIQTLSNQKIQIKGSLIIDKDVTINGNLTYNGANGSSGSLLFPPGSRPFLYGQIEDHTDGNWVYHAATTWASGCGTTNEQLHACVEQVLWGSKHGNLRTAIGGDNYGNSSGDQTRQYMVAFIKNTKSTPVNQQLCWDWASAPWNSNYASLALNGTDVWTYSSNNLSQSCQTLTFPASQTSVVVLKVGYYYWTMWNGTWNKSVIGFYNDSFNFNNNGLEFDYKRYEQFLANQ